MFPPRTPYRIQIFFLCCCLMFQCQCKFPITLILCRNRNPRFRDSLKAGQARLTAHLALERFRFAEQLPPPRNDFWRRVKTFAESFPLVRRQAKLGLLHKNSVRGVIFPHTESTLGPQPVTKTRCFAEKPQKLLKYYLSSIMLLANFRFCLTL